MADTLVKDFTSKSPIVATDEWYINDVAGGNVDKKATAANIKTFCSDAPTLDAPIIVYSINAQTGTSYTTVLSDAGAIITSNNASAVTITIPPNSSVAYEIGSSITIISIGAGLTTIAQGSGVTITSTGATPSAPVLRAQHSSATAIKTGTNTWRVVGDIA